MIDAEYTSDDLLVFGGGGHAKSVIDMIRAIGKYRIAGIIDDHMDAGSLVLNVPVLGGAELLDDYRQRGLRLIVNTVGGIGKPEVRVKIFQRLQEAGYEFPALIHPKAFVEPTATLSDGTQVLPLAYVGSDSRIGFGCIINYGAIMSHDCDLGACVNLSPGATLAGGVHVGERTQIGMRATVNLELTIGRDVRIGNGATVKKDVPDGAIIKAGSIWPVKND